MQEGFSAYEVGHEQTWYIFITTNFLEVYGRVIILFDDSRNVIG